MKLSFSLGKDQEKYKRIWLVVNSNSYSLLCPIRGIRKKKKLFRSIDDQPLGHAISFRIQLGNEMFFRKALLQLKNFITLNRFHFYIR